MMASFSVNLDLLRGFNFLKMPHYTTVTAQICIACYSRRLLKWEQHSILGHAWKRTQKTMTVQKLQSMARPGEGMLLSVQMGLKVAQGCLSLAMRIKLWLQGT